MPSERFSGPTLSGLVPLRVAGQAVLSVQMEATLDDFARASFPHPTLSESLSDAARDALGEAVYLP